MFLGKFYITQHAVEQYEKRVGTKHKKTPIQCIYEDLRTLNIKRVIYKDEHVYIFTRCHKEFIFIKNKNKLYLKTVIKRSRNKTNWTIHKRQRQKNLVTA